MVEPFFQVNVGPYACEGRGLLSCHPDTHVGSSVKACAPMLEDPASSYAHAHLWQGTTEKDRQKKSMLAVAALAPQPPLSTYLMQNHVTARAICGRRICPHVHIFQAYDNVPLEYSVRHHRLFGFDPWSSPACRRRHTHTPILVPPVIHV